MKKIVFVGGGTLGHIYPILPVVEKIHQQYELYFIGTTSGLERPLIEKNQYFKKTFFLDMQGFKRKLTLDNLKTIKKYFQCYRQGKKILQQIAPQLIIGMGGYISGVIVKVAKKMKISAIIHEQNSILGLANRFVLRKVDAVLLNFPIKKKINSKNVVLIGNPRLSQIYQNHLIKNEVKRFLLVVGGSRGSKVINEVIISLLPKLQEHQFQVLLITGNSFYQQHQQTLLSLNNHHIQIIPFTNNFISYLKKASIVISRAGATTIAEIIGLRKIAILIPSPNVTQNHQEENANVLVNNNCAIKINEKDLDKDKLLKTILDLETNYHQRTIFVSNMMKHFNYQACDDFIKEMEKYL